MIPFWKKSATVLLRTAAQLGPSDATGRRDPLTWSGNTRSVRRGRPDADDDGRSWLDTAYEEHGGEIYGYCRRVTGDPGLAEEITQDVFVRAWRARQQFDGGYDISRVVDARGIDLDHTIVKTMMRIDLPRPLEPGASFTFMTTMTRRGNSFTQTFSGTVEGDEMSGTITGGRGERPFTGIRGS